MTERALRLPPAAPASPTLDALPARPATRSAAAARRPVHVAVAIGVTAGLYAVSLAGVTGLQADTDARLAAERAPAAAAVDVLRTSHDRAEADLARIAAGYGDAATTYQQIADSIASHEAALGVLGERIAAVEGSAAALRVPTVSRLPTVSSRTVYVARPVTNACTAASGKTC
ncbi:MAG TPA: hypothetical protein VER83_00435 [Candidatus Nanopelagicales bacterium]|nr:hypothetical protein [Candidatus Nanopelagicales bacterium]